MSVYAAIDLHSSNSVLAVVDEADRPIDATENAARSIASSPSRPLRTNSRVACCYLMRDGGAFDVQRAFG